MKRVHRYQDQAFKNPKIFVNKERIYFEICLSSCVAKHQAKRKLEKNYIVNFKVYAGKWKNVNNK